MCFVMRHVFPNSWQQSGFTLDLYIVMCMYNTDIKHSCIRVLEFNNYVLTFYFQDSIPNKKQK